MRLRRPPFDCRGVIGGMANAFGRSLFAMGRVKYALHWPTYLRIEFVTLWQGVSTFRVDIFGWDLEPPAGGSPSKRYWDKAKRIAEEMKACWNLGRQEVMAVSPAEGPAGASKGHGALGNWSSSEENGAPRSRAPKASAPPSPVQYSPGPNQGPAPQAPSSSTPAAGWGARITEVLANEERGSLTDPLEGWSHRDQY